MKIIFRTFLLSIFMISFLFIQEAKSQLIIDQTLTDQQLAQSLVGPGVTISNVQVTCHPNSYARFVEGTSNLGLPEGVVLTTGIANELINPATFFFSTNMGRPGDALLSGIAGGATNDACIFQFNVVPQGDTLRFRYRFGSQEYPNFVNSSFNDVFAFLITGPNPLGGNYINENIALIPGTNVPVTINTVNNGTANNGPCVNCAYYVNNQSAASPTNQTIALNGMTTVLEAIVEVVPCQTYTLRLGIADVADGIYDSGVFVEELSSPEITLNLQTEAGTPNAIAGCNNGIITFSTNFASNDPLIIYYVKGGDAVEGINYTPIPDSVIIQPGQFSTSIIIEALVDSFNQGGDSLVIGIVNPCSGQLLDSVVLYITDQVEVTVPFDTATICEGESIQLDADGALLYNWIPQTNLNNPDIKNPVASPTTSTLYTVIGRVGLCEPDTNEIMINVTPLPVLTAGPDLFICDEDTIQITQAFSNADTTFWSPGDYLSSTTEVNPFLNAPPSNMQYVLTGSNSGCTITDTMIVNVASELSLNLLPGDTTICQGDAVNLSVSGAPSFIWSPAIGLSNPNSSNPVATPNITTTYVVTGVSPNCPIVFDTITIEVTPRPDFQSSEDQSMCTGDTILLSASGGSNYEWSPANLTTEPNNANTGVFPIQNTAFTVIMSEGICVQTDTIFVEVNELPVVTISDEATICLNDSLQLTASGGNVYAWSPEEFIVDANEQNPLVYPQSTTTYTVIVTNTLTNCSNSDEVTVNVTVPVVNAGNDIMTCPNQTNIIGTQGLPGYTYSWSPTAGISNPNVGSTTISLGNATAEDINTTYVLTATDPTGCSLQDSISVTIFNKMLTATTFNPDPDPITGVTTVFQGETVQLEVLDGSGCNWTPPTYLSNPNSCSPIATPDSSITYTITGVNLNGCPSSATLTIEVNYVSDIFIPNAFAPGRAEPNNTIRPFVVGQYELRSFRIYNRWGQLIFETNDDMIGWDGRFKGELQPNGTYVYHVVFLNDEGVEKDGTGTLNLVR